MIPNNVGPAGASYIPPTAVMVADMKPPTIPVPGGSSRPVKEIKPHELVTLAQRLNQLWMQYRSDRRIAELRWLRNERQYLGVYDPEIDKQMSANRSRAYPKLTRWKCISVLSRLMNLMFPGDERNWALKASPNADMSIKDIQKAVADKRAQDAKDGIQPVLDLEYINDAVQTLADKNADDLSTLIDDQLEELGGDQSLDYVLLNRQVVRQGIIQGLGLLEGPFPVPKKRTTWELAPDGTPTPKIRTVYTPCFQFLKIWDFYPDMSSKTLRNMDGYFKRLVMSRSQVKALGKRMDFMADQIDEYLKAHSIGNYRPLEFEQELRAMGVKTNVNEIKAETSKYEIIVWTGKMGGEFLALGGVDVPPDKLAEELDAEIWMIDSNVICCKINPWEELDVEIETLHYFLFDEDDTSPIGLGLPTVMRDTQMGLSAATRMLMDNASVVCGPQLEMNTDLLRADQDLASISAYKIWYRTGEGLDAQWPAVREIKIDSHIEDLQGIIELFLKFSDAETFVGPATGGDMATAPSEPFRTAAGASMMKGDAALPFKDIVRSFDQFTMSVLQSLVQFNKMLNPEQAPEGDYNVLARGATSLIAKEMRGMQIDQLAQTMTDEEKLHVDMRKFIKARFGVRDLLDLLVPESVADAKEKAQSDAAAQTQQQQQNMIEAQIRETLANAFKNIAQGQKNSAAANADAIDAALALLEAGVKNALGTGGQAGGTGQQAGPTGGSQGAPQPPGGDGGSVGLAPDGASAGGPQGSVGGMPPGPSAGPPGGGFGLQ